MPGWNLLAGKKEFIHLTDSEVMRIVNSALSPAKRHTTTYKYAFFKSILDNIFNVDSDSQFLSYDSLALRFTEIYWNLILKFHLSQMPGNAEGKTSKIEQLLQNFCSENNFDFIQTGIDFPFESLRSDLQLKISKIIKNQVVMKYVLGAFWEDTEGQFYSFDKKDDGIYFNPDAVLFLCKYKTDFEKLNYYEWIKYLEKVNAKENAFALASKLDASTERNNLSAYRSVLQDFGQRHCFYCNKPLGTQTQKASPVDHFIPWSFTKDDKLWNFVLACPNCNSSKSNFLPQFEYVEKMKMRNSRLINFSAKIIEEDFKTYTYSKLVQMFHSAAFNGFSSNWKPSRVLELD